jgi:hypothetical protein
VTAVLVCVPLFLMFYVSHFAFINLMCFDIIMKM